MLRRYFPETLSSVIYELFKVKQRLQPFDIKLYMYQVFRSLRTFTRLDLRIAISNRTIF